MDSSDPRSKGKCEGSRRKSAIPKPTPKVAPPPPQAAPSCDVIYEEDDDGPGILESTPSFEQFVAGLSAFDDDELDPEPGDASSEAGMPAVVPAGDHRPAWISTTSPSFAGFLAEVAAEEDEPSGIVQPPRPLPVTLDLTLGEKFQAAPGDEDHQSKNEKRHHQKRRRRTSNATEATVSFDATLPAPAAIEKKSSVFYDALQIQNQTTSFTTLTTRTATLLSRGRKLDSSFPEPLTFMPTESEETMLPWSFLPVNLRRISAKELKSFFASMGHGVRDPSVIVDPLVEMFQTHDEAGLIGCISIRNQTTRPITFRIRASSGRKYRVSPTVGEVPIGGEGKAYVETLKNLRLTFDEVKGDRFAVDILQLKRPAIQAPGLTVIWKSGVAGQWRFPVEVIEGFSSDPGLAARRRYEQEASEFEKGLMKTMESSHEIFELRCLEREIGSPVRCMHLEHQVRVNPAPPAIVPATPRAEAEGLTMSYAEFFGSLLFGLLLLGFMTFILFL